MFDGLQGESPVFSRMDLSWHESPEIIEAPEMLGRSRIA